MPSQQNNCQVESAIAAADIEQIYNFRHIKKLDRVSVLESEPAQLSRQRGSYLFVAQPSLVDGLNFPSKNNCRVEQSTCCNCSCRRWTNIATLKRLTEYQCSNLNQLSRVANAVAICLIVAKPTTLVDGFELFVEWYCYTDFKVPIDWIEQCLVCWSMCPALWRVRIR